MADDSKAARERLAKALEAYHFGLQVPDPEAALGILRDAQRRKTPGDPFNTSIDQFVDFVLRNPDALRGTEPTDYLRKYLRLASDHVKTMVAGKLNNPALERPGVLNVEVDDDWQIDASVEEQSPHTVRVSTNLFLFCARIGELLIAGRGLMVVDDDPNARTHAAPAPYSVEAVATRIRTVLDSFIADQTIAKTDIHLNAAHFLFHQMIHHSIMALIICHEFGHVVIQAARQAGEPVPFQERARAEIDGNARQVILSGRLDPKDAAGLRKLSPAALREVLGKWENEITADLIGVSLAAEYVRDRGPWKDRPAILGIAYIGFHLCFMAQYFLHRYLNLRRPAFPLLSATHPPVDFRMHCILSWMYNCPAKGEITAAPYGENEAYREITQYSQSVLSKIVR